MCCINQKRIVFGLYACVKDCFMNKIVMKKAKKQPKNVSKTYTAKEYLAKNKGK